MPFAPGQSGNPKGRPLASRQRIAEKLLSEFAALLDTDAAKLSLQRLMVDMPEQFWTIAAGLLPREVAATLTVQQRTPEGLTPDEWSDLVGILQTIKRLGGDGSTTEIAERVQRALHLEFSTAVVELLPAPPPL